MARLFAATTLAIAIICMGCASSPAKQNIADEKTPAAAIKEEPVVVIPSGPEPGWVSGGSIGYPRVDYITSRTEAETPEQASQMAIANITRYFLIDTIELNMTPEQTAFAADYTLNTSNLDSSAQTVAPAEITRVLAKIELAAQWYDSDNNRYHALAAVPRNTSRSYLAGQIKMLDSKTETFMQEARSNPDPLAQAGNIAKAWRCQQIRSKLQDSMRVADLTARGVEPRFNLKLVKKDAINLLTTLQIEASGVAGEMNAIQVTDMIKGGFKTAGIKAAEDNADYIMRGTLDTSIIGEKNGWAVGRGQLKLVLADKLTGELRGTKVWEIEVPGLTEDHAIRRVNEKTVYKLKRDMRNILMEMAM